MKFSRLLPRDAHVELHHGIIPERKLNAEVIVCESHFSSEIVLPLLKPRQMTYSGVHKDGARCDLRQFMAILVKQIMAAL
jgi:hypothetical protein